jgi:hypothetical protein
MASLPINIATANSLPILNLPPDSQGFSDTPDDGIVETTLDGGAPRQRLDLVGTIDTVSVRWSVGPDGYNYLRSFYRTVMGRNGGVITPFIFALPIDTSDPTENHQCMFQKGSFKLASQQGLQYVVQATLYVWPAAIDPNDDAERISAYGE